MLASCQYSWLELEWGKGAVRESELIGFGARMNIHRDKLLGLLALTGDHRRQEVDHLLGMVSLREVEIQTILGLLDVDGIFVRAVLQDQLLQVEERPLVRYFLPNLNDSSESMMGEAFHAVRTLLCSDHVFHLKCLLNDCALKCFLLNCDLDLDTARMGFGPDEAGVDDSDFREATKFAKADGQQLF